MAFRFEELIVYQESLSFFCKISPLVQQWPSQYRFNLADQLMRASLSILLNIAEGSSRTRKDFQHFLIMARGSCYESLAILTVANELHLITNEVYEKLRDKLDQIAKMLTSLKNKT